MAGTEIVRARAAAAVEQGDLVRLVEPGERPVIGPLPEGGLGFGVTVGSMGAGGRGDVVVWGPADVNVAAGAAGDVVGGVAVLLDAPVAGVAPAFVKGV